VIDEQVAFLGGVDIAYGRYENDNYSVFDHEEIYTGRDYVNLNWLSETNGKSDEKVYDRNFPRMPWHDIHMLCTGVSAIDVASNFIGRWNYTVKSQNGVALLFPLADTTKTPIDHYMQQLPKNLPIFNNCDIQIVRSISDWALPIRYAENSIYQAYVTSIKESKHFIFIANQYFISSIDRELPKNRILNALYKRIKLAIRKKEKFKVIIVLPVHPAGDINSPTTLYIIKYTYKSINRQGESLFAKLENDFPNVDLSEYVSFHCLRNYGKMGDSYHSEGIYVHAKLMIVDDCVAIIGSANINDRSMRGTRDTELCAVVEGKEMISIMMNDKVVQVSKFAHSLRIRLMTSYLGISQTNVEEVKKVIDVLSDDFQELWHSVSHSNTKIYQEVFKLIPNNIVDSSNLWALKPTRVNPDIAKTN
jgi:phospholipase D1/2